MYPLVFGHVKDDSKTNFHFLECKQFTPLFILLIMFLSSRITYIFHPMISDLNLSFYKLSYLVKNLFTFRPVGGNISLLKILIWPFFWFILGRKASQIAVPSENLFPRFYMAPSHSIGLCSVQFNDTFCNYPVKIMT